MAEPGLSSRLHLPGHPLFASAAAAYVAELASRLGFGPADVEKLRRAAEEAGALAAARSREEGWALECQPAARGLVVRIQDRGAPLDSERLEPPFLGLLRSAMDEVHFLHRGREGNEIRLIKRFGGEAPRLFSHPPELKEGEPEEVAEVRLVRPEEAVGVSRCLYEAYGYTYAGSESVYHPEWIAEMNRTGELISAVAVTASEASPDGATRGGEVVGHVALVRTEEDPEVYEMAQAAVVPAYRGRNLFHRLIGFLLEEAERRGLKAVHAEPVTHHPYSQRAILRFGFRECALLLGCVPPEEKSRGLEGPPEERISLLCAVKILRSGPPHPVYAPLDHELFLRRTCEVLGLERVFHTVPLPEPPMPRYGRIRTRVHAPMGKAVIQVERVGEDSRGQVLEALRELSDAPVVHADLELDDPHTPAFCRFLEDRGFSYAGMIPERGRGDRLRMQRLQRLEVDFDGITIASEWGREVAAYVRECWERARRKG